MFGINWKCKKIDLSLFQMSWAIWPSGPPWWKLFLNLLLNLVLNTTEEAHSDLPKARQALINSYTAPVSKMYTTSSNMVNNGINTFSSISNTARTLPVGTFMQLLNFWFVIELNSYLLKLHHVIFMLIHNYKTNFSYLFSFYYWIISF